ncbi:MAG: hypothetical protein WAU91_05015, partial [Desulfatitalea sp.]
MRVILSSGHMNGKIQEIDQCGHTDDAAADPQRLETYPTKRLNTTPTHGLQQFSVKSFCFGKMNAQPVQAMVR